MKMTDKNKLWLNNDYYMTNPQGDGLYYKDDSLVFTWKQLDAILIWMDFVSGFRKGRGIE